MLKDPKSDLSKASEIAFYYAGIVTAAIMLEDAGPDGVGLIGFAPHHFGIWMVGLCGAFLIFWRWPQTALALWLRRIGLFLLVFEVILFPISIFGGLYVLAAMLRALSGA